MFSDMFCEHTFSWNILRGMGRLQSVVSIIKEFSLFFVRVLAEHFHRNNCAKKGNGRPQSKRTVSSAYVSEWKSTCGMYEYIRKQLRAHVTAPVQPLLQINSTPLSSLSRFNMTRRNGNCRSCPN